MIKRNSFVPFALFVQVLKAVHSTCPYEWENAGKCYFFGTTLKSYDDAQSDCSSLNGYLAEPLTGTEIAYLRDTVRLSGATESYWIGGTDTDIEGSWTWVTKNQSFTETDWGTLQPDSSGGVQNCLVLYQPQNFLWNDHFCTSLNRYVCELRVNCSEGQFKCKDETCISNWLLCNGEIECMIDGEDEEGCGDHLNVALGKDTTQTSVWHSSESWYAVDGFPHLRIHPDTRAWGCAHTWLGPTDRWWAVDLGAVYHVKRVNVMNRDDGHFYYLFSNINADVIMPTECNECDCEKWQTFQQGEITKCFYEHGTSLPLTIGNNCPEGTKGRFVKIYKTNSAGELIICEVQVFGNIIEVIGNETEVGGSCSIPMSSTECLDQNAICSTENNRNKCRCTHCYYDNDLDDDNIGGNCTRKRYVGEACSGLDVECFDVNAFCATDGKCRCHRGFVYSVSDDDNDRGACIMTGPPDSKGMEFIIAFMDNLHDNLEPELILSTTQTSPVDVSVVTTSHSETFTISSGLEKKITLSTHFRLKDTEYSKKGILIRASNEITVIGINQPDRFVGLPTDVLGSEYYVVTYHSLSFTTQLCIAGVEDGTIVTIQLGSCNDCGSVTYASKAYNKGDTLTIDLDRYDVVQLHSNGDLTGTRISSNKKISVFSGNKAISVGTNASIGNAVESLPPISTWGKVFVITPTQTDPIGNYLKIIASETGTAVTYKCGLEGLIDSGSLTFNKAGDFEQLSISAGKYCQIKADKSILIVQIVQGKESTNPSMFSIPPVELYDNDYSFTTPTPLNGPNTNYLLFVVNSADRFGLRLDGSPLPMNTVYHSIPDTEYVGGFVIVSGGAHTVHHLSPISVFSAVAYGVSDVESYVFYVGLRLAPINTVCTISSSSDGDGIDNDCDGLIDEELCTLENFNKDDDGDSKRNEDCSEPPFVVNPCRSGWYYYQDACYYFSIEDMDWHSAQTTCESRLGTLAEGNTVSKINYLTAKATELGLKRSKYIRNNIIDLRVWIGGNDIITEGVWLWTHSGQIVTESHNWWPGQPNSDTGDEDCAAMDSDVNYKWVAFDCSENHGFVCQERLPVPEIRLLHQNEEFELECYVNTTYINFTHFLVKWTWDGGKQMEIFDLSENLEIMTLSASLVQKIGSMISCTIEGRWSDNVTILTFTSTEFYPKIKTDSSVTIEKGGQGVIIYQLSFPFTCQGCQVSLRVKEIEASPGDICGGDISLLDVDSCSTNIVVDMNWNLTRYLKIKHRSNQQYGIQQNMYKLKLQGVVTVLQETFTTDLPEITINVVQNKKEWSKYKCFAYCDPHMKTFDGLNYEHQQRGTYYMYRNKALAAGIEVQVKLASCNYNIAWCVCGMAVRAGADVFAISFCDGSVSIDFESCEYNPVLHAAKTADNKYYMITTPTGTVVYAKLVILQGGYFLDISIRPSLEDVGNTEGLCGTLNEDCGDDFMKPDGTVTQNNTLCNNGYYWLFDKEFSNSWEVPASTDLFNPSRTVEFPKWNYPEQLCACNRNGTSVVESCGVHSNVYCVYPGYVAIESSECRNRLQPGESLVIVSNRTKPLFNVVEPVVPEDKKLNVTETEAREHCMKSMEKSAAFSTCSDLNAFNVEQFIDICTMDVTLTQSSLWLDNAVELLRSDCHQEIEKNSTLKNSSDVSIDNLCPGFPDICSGHGTCKEGSCECGDGFTGSDCSTDVHKPPDVTTVINDGLCDGNTTACDSVSVFGRNIQGSIVFCQLQTYFVTPENITYGEAVTVPGETVSLFEAKCDIPQSILEECRDISVIVKGVKVYIGYNDVNFSTTDLRSVLYDSSCQIYDQVTSSFSIAEGKCFINCKCFSDGDTNPNNSSQVCNSIASLYEWNNSTASNDKAMTTTKTILTTSAKTDSTTSNDRAMTTTKTILTTSAKIEPSSTTQKSTRSSANTNNCNDKFTKQAIILSVSTAGGVLVSILMFICCFMTITNRKQRKHNEYANSSHRHIEEKSLFNKYKREIKNEDKKLTRVRNNKICCASVCCGCWGFPRDIEENESNGPVQYKENRKKKERSSFYSYGTGDDIRIPVGDGNFYQSNIGSSRQMFDKQYHSGATRRSGINERSGLCLQEKSRKEHVSYYNEGNRPYRTSNSTGSERRAYFKEVETDSFDKYQCKGMFIYKGSHIEELLPNTASKSDDCDRPVVHSVDGKHFQKGVYTPYKMKHTFADTVPKTETEIRHMNSDVVTIDGRGERSSEHLYSSAHRTHALNQSVSDEEELWYSVEAYIPDMAEQGINVVDSHDEENWIGIHEDINRKSELKGSQTDKNIDVNMVSKSEITDVLDKNILVNISTLNGGKHESTKPINDDRTEIVHDAHIRSETSMERTKPPSTELNLNSTNPLSMVPNYEEWYLNKSGYWGRKQNKFRSTGDRYLKTRSSIIVDSSCSRSDRVKSKHRKEKTRRYSESGRNIKDHQASRYEDYEQPKSAHHRTRSLPNNMRTGNKRFHRHNFANSTSIDGRNILYRDLNRYNRGHQTLIGSDGIELMNHTTRYWTEDADNAPVGPYNYGHGYYGGLENNSGELQCVYSFESDGKYFCRGYRPPSDSNRVDGYPGYWYPVKYW